MKHPHTEDDDEPDQLDNRPLMAGCALLIVLMLINLFTKGQL